MRLDRVNKQADGQEGHEKCGQAGSQAAPDRLREQTCSSPDVVTSHVTAISQVGRELNAPFLSASGAKS